MIADWIRKAVADIALHSADAETAHCMQDYMLRQVLEQIAAHPEEPVAQLLAREALRVFDVPFARWCSS